MHKFLVGMLLILGAALAKDMELSFEIGETYNDSFRMFGKTFHTTPQIAVWLEDSSGTYVTTLMVTRKAAKGNYAGHRGAREESLPVWAFARSVRNRKGGFMPLTKSALPDAITGASVKTDFVWLLTIADEYFNNGYSIKLEINNSMDFNEYYKKDKEKNSANGQPSLVYQLPLDEENSGFTLLGQGDPMGNDGDIDPVDSHLTSALKIVKKISITIKE